MSTEPVPVPVPSLYIGVCRHRHTPNREAVPSVSVPGHTKRAHIARRLGKSDALGQPWPFNGAIAHHPSRPETHYCASSDVDADYCVLTPSHEGMQ